MSKQPKHLTVYDDAGDYYGDETWDDDPRDWDEEDGDYEDCGLMPDGQCLKAGSEECDWECPYRMSEHFAGSPAWHKKHGE
jgi:hypothetical protein